MDKLRKFFHNFWCSWEYDCTPKTYIFTRQCRICKLKQQEHSWEEIIDDPYEVLQGCPFPSQLIKTHYEWKNIT
jgi:hypothetical protein